MDCRCLRGEIANLKREEENCNWGDEGGGGGEWGDKIARSLPQCLSPEAEWPGLLLVEIGGKDFLNEKLSTFFTYEYIPCQILCLGTPNKMSSWTLPFGKRGISECLADTASTYSIFS